MLDIWLKAGGQTEIKPMMAKIYRIVESQEQSATLGLVNDVYEQGILEELIESTKNPFPKHCESLNYLLKTPFRYPPLMHGSRFGTAFEQGIFYGSLTIETALCETAYYRFVYMLGQEEPFQGIIASEYTSFSVPIKSNLGVFLDKIPFSDYQPSLTSPSSYLDTQALGSSMREAGVEIFQYISARDINQGKNAGIFSPKVFQSNQPSSLTTWLCQTSFSEVGFLSKEEKQRVLYKQQEFWIGNELPSPAI